MKICLKDKNDDTKNSSIFKMFFSNLAQNLIYKRPSSSIFFTESKVSSYYDDVKFKELNITSKNITFFERFKRI